ncbi:MAG: AAA family ATPase [Betaproteobacteria bacterium]|nr:AAA family ATPase [Betaproteobacteria bacterium]
MPSPDTNEFQQGIFAFLADPASHGLAEAVQRINTHVAVVFLAGAEVYKVKRAVRYAYLDFSTLEKRRAACAAEIEVNQHNAPDLYLGVVPITRDASGFHLNGPGEIVEWTVHLRRFDENATLDHLAANGQLDAPLIAALAEAVARAHQAAPGRDGATASAALRQQLLSTLDELGEAGDLFPADRLDTFRRHAITAFERNAPLLLQRGQQGCVRRCHGDLYLANIALIGGAPVLFDAIEFNEAFATCDILYDLAFLVMDLCQRGPRGAAGRLLDRYLRLGGDERREIAGLAALPLFLALRAAIRAKVTAAQARLAGDGQMPLRARALSYFELAARFLQAFPPLLVAVGGLSGSGKSTLAAVLAPAIGPAPGALHLRSDVMRKHLMGVGETVRLPPDAYLPAVSERVFAELHALARIGLRAGRTVIVDATHLRPEDRAAVAGLAHESGAAFVGLWLEAPVDLLKGRVDQRLNDASDATAAVVEAQVPGATAPADWLRLDASQPIEQLTEAALRHMPADALVQTPW